MRASLLAGRFSLFNICIFTVIMDYCLLFYIFYELANLDIKFNCKNEHKFTIFLQTIKNSRFAAKERSFPSATQL